MDTPVFHAILFVMTFTQAMLMIYGFIKMGRALKERPDDPKLKFGAKFLWVFPVGIVFAAVVATMAAIDWLRVTR